MSINNNEFNNIEWEPNDAPVFIVLGQSNSYGHNTKLPASEQIM